MDLHAAAAGDNDARRFAGAGAGGERGGCDSARGGARGGEGGGQRGERRTDCAPQNVPDAEREEDDHGVHRKLLAEEPRLEETDLAVTVAR